MPGGGATLFGYDAHHSVVTTTALLTMIPSTSGFTLNWQATLTRYDAYGERTATIDGRGFVAPLTSQSSTGNIVLPTPQLDPVQAPLVTRSYTYTAQGDLQSASTPPLTTTLNGVVQANQPVTTSYGYNGDDDVIAITSTNRAVTTQSVDHLGRLTRVTQPGVPLYDGTAASPVQTHGYDGDGHVGTTTDALGAAVVRSYDPLGWLVALRNPLGRTALVTYTAMQLTATQDLSGTVTRYAADALGRPSTVTDPLGVQTSYGYDAVGNTRAITTPLDFAHVATTTVEQRSYEALNRLAALSVLGTGGVAPTSPQTSTTSYDPDGNVALGVTPGGSMTYDTYDMADRLMNTYIYTDVAGSPLAGQSVTFDLAHNPTQIDDLAGQTHTASFDGANRVLQAGDCTVPCPNVAPITTTPSYDPDGNVLALTRTVGSAPGVTATATYNALDWLSSQDDGQGKTTYGYDAAGRLRTQSLLGGAGVVTATLNAAGLATALSEAVTATGQTRPSTSASQFTYTAADLPATDTLNSGGGAAAVSESRTAFARVTGFEAVTMERRLYNFLTQTLPQLGVPIRRIFGTVPPVYNWDRDRLAGTLGCGVMGNPP